jgi:hypothetical protein
MPRQRRETPEPPAPPWLIRLREDIFARVPADVPAWAWDGVVYHCTRAVRDTPQALRFEEVWHDPVTFAVQHRWALPIQAGAFAGLHDARAWAQSVEVILQGIEHARPHLHVPRVQERAFDPGRFARDREVF